MDNDLDTNKIKNWRSIITLIVFVLTNIVVLFPFHIPIYVPRLLIHGTIDLLSSIRIIPPRPKSAPVPSRDGEGGSISKPRKFVRMRLPMNFITAPLIADLFLLAILAIGRKEVHDGTVGADNIAPIDIMVFFITLAYIAISIDASGLIRWLAFKVLQRGGQAGHMLYFYLYLFFLALATLAGNDPIVLSGTPFLAYMTSVSRNIKDPKAWIFMQFSVANVGSAILVSSNPTNLVLAGAFSIKFVQYTANIIVPVVSTTIVLFPFLLYVLFRNDSLIPKSIELHELPAYMKDEKPVNPNIRPPPGTRQVDSKEGDSEAAQLVMLKEILNPYVDKKSATVGAVIMIATLVTILALNAASPGGNEHPVFWITLPAAFVTFCWGLAYEWHHRQESRELSRAAKSYPADVVSPEQEVLREKVMDEAGKRGREGEPSEAVPETLSVDRSQSRDTGRTAGSDGCDKTEKPDANGQVRPITDVPARQHADEKLDNSQSSPTTLQSLLVEAYTWARETFPTVTTVVEHLPFPLVPFALCMFVLVQGLVTRGWVPVFAYGWKHWVDRTGTVGAIGGMGFLSVVLCNFAGTNIGTTILLCRLVQLWVQIEQSSGATISQRTFWATIYSMAIGLNYGAFSTAFSASLAGMLWRDILTRKHIHVSRTAFARINLPIISVTMIVGLAVLVGEVYIVRKDTPYNPG